MQVESNSKWVKDDEIITVFGTVPVTKDCKHLDCVLFQHSIKPDYIHILTKRDFLEQYKPYEPVYEYLYAYEFVPNDMRITREYFINTEINKAIAELEEAMKPKSCLSCVSCCKDTQLLSSPPQYTLLCGIFKTVFVNDFKQSCSRYNPKEQL